MKKNPSKKSLSLFFKISAPLAGLLCLQIIILLGAVQLIAVRGLKENVQLVETEQLEARRSDIQSLIMSKWTDLDIAIRQLDSLYEDHVATGKDMLEQGQQAQFLLEAYPTLVTVLRQNETNGIFLILNKSEIYEKYTEGDTRWGLGIRDYDCESNYLGEEDLVAVRSPASIQSSICSADGLWENIYTFKTQENSMFYYEPLRQAYLNPDASSTTLGYFSDAYYLKGNDSTEVVSYSIPLFYDNKPYGVLGVEISTKYYGELLAENKKENEFSSAYVLAGMKNNSENFETIAKSGSYYTWIFGSSKEIKVKEEIGDQVFLLESSHNETTVGFISEFTLYEKNSPFSDNQIFLIKIIDEDALYKSTNRFSNVLLLISGCTIIICVLGVLISSKVITDPIKRLAKAVENSDVEGDVTLDYLGITEIDGLVGSIEQMHKRMEENMAKTEFFARMSHDMRTPMNAIIGFSDKSIVTNANHDQLIDYLDKINSSGKYLLALINDVLDISKISNGQLNMVYEEAYHSEIWDSTLPIIEEIAKNKGVSFRVIDSFDQQQNQLLVIDKYRLQQIFTNLLSNAIKFTPPSGGVVLEVKELEKDLEKVVVEYKISDTGCGMSKEFLTNLYKPFMQEHPGEGTGLGLSICKNLIDLLNGTIECKSTVNVGTTFTVTLCHAIVESSPKKISTKIESQVITSLKGKRVLLCEDNLINKQIAELQLKNAEMIVEHAIDGIKAVEMFKQSYVGYYDIVIMDIQMPNMNGLDATKEIRKLYRNDAKTILIIAMTANTFDEDILACKKAGMNDHIGKPINPILLYEIILKYLK